MKKIIINFSNLHLNLPIFSFDKITLYSYDKDLSVIFSEL